MRFVPCDLEANGLLEDVTKIHCLGIEWYGEYKVTSEYSDIVKFFSGDYYFVMHNGLCYDRPLLKKILSLDIPHERFIDTLAISWALHPKREKHGLESWGEELGVVKPAIEDWENLTQEDYNHRVREDAKIQTLLWKKFVGELTELYGDNVNSKGEPMWLSYVKYLSFKMYTLSIQERYPFKLDIPACEANLAKLEAMKEERVVALAGEMPKQNVIHKQTKPKKCFKADGSHSSLGAAWFNLIKERGLTEDFDGFVEVIKSYNEPNPASSTQVKDWLFSLGWEPLTFKAGANGEVPQLKNGDELCESVKVLIKKSPAIEHLDKMGVLTHRIGLLKGFLRDHKDGYITAGAHGFTSTLRLRHRGVVNLPKPSIEYGELIRGVLTCDGGYELCDSDLASLEDRIRLDLIYDLNPEKVQEKLAPDYDAHLATAVTAGLMSEEDVAWYKEAKVRIKNNHELLPQEEERVENLSNMRHMAKTTNYGSAYGIGKVKLAKTLGITPKKAKELLDAYWVVNREAKIIQETWEVKTSLGREWILNPYNKYWYELRSSKDKLSAIIQSSGDFVCYLWTKYILDQREQLTLVYHDQTDFIVKVGHREEMSKILRNAIDKVNKTLKFKVPMDISINFGQYLNEVH